MRLDEVYQQDEQNEAIEGIEGLQETVNMTRSQYNAEMAGFVDAWPGAAIDLENAEAHLASVKLKLGHHLVEM